MDIAQDTKFQQVQELIGRMQKNLECAICLEMLKTPVSTKCDHHFCRYCIVECLQKKSSVPCPLCKKPVTKRSLNDQTKLANIVDGVRALIAAFQQDTGVVYTPKKGPTAVSLIPFSPEPTCSQRRSKRQISLQDDTRKGRERKRSKRQKLNDNGDDLSSHVADPTIGVLETDLSEMAQSSCDTVHYTYSPGSLKTKLSPVEKRSLLQCDERYIKPNLNELHNEVKDSSLDSNNDGSSVDLLSAMRSGLLRYLNEGSCGAAYSSAFDENSYPTQLTVDLPENASALIRQIENAEFKPNTQSLSSSENEESNLIVRSLEIVAEQNETNLKHMADSVCVTSNTGVEKDFIKTVKCVDNNNSAIEETESNQSYPTIASDNCSETWHVLPSSAISKGNITTVSDTDIKIGVFGSQCIEQTHLKDTMPYHRTKRNRKNIDKVKNWMSTLPRGSNFDSVVDNVNVLNNTDTRDDVNMIPNSKNSLPGTSHKSTASEIYDVDIVHQEQDLVTSDNEKLESKSHDMPHKIIDLTDCVVDEGFVENRQSVLKTIQKPMRRIFKSRLLNGIHKSPNKPKCNALHPKSPKRDPYEFNPSQKTPKGQRNKMRKTRVTNKGKKSRVTEKKKVLQLQITQGILERKSRKNKQTSSVTETDAVPLETKQIDDVINLDNDTQNEYQETVVDRLESIANCEETPDINDDLGKKFYNNCEDGKNSVILSQTHDSTASPSVICGRKVFRKIRNCDKNGKSDANWNEIVKKDTSVDRSQDSVVDVINKNTGVDINHTDNCHVVVKTSNMNYELKSPDSCESSVLSVRRSRLTKKSRKEHADAKFQKNSDTVVVKMTSELNQVEDYELMFCSQDVHAKLSRVRDENSVADYQGHENNVTNNKTRSKSNIIPNDNENQLTEQHNTDLGEDVDKGSPSQLSDLSSAPNMDIIGPSPHIFKGTTFKLPRCLPPSARLAGRVRRLPHPLVEVEDNVDALALPQSPTHQKCVKEPLKTKTERHQNTDIKLNGLENNVSPNNGTHKELQIVPISDCNINGDANDVINISIPATCASIVEAKSTLHFDSFKSLPIPATDNYSQPSMNDSEPVMVNAVRENGDLIESETVNDEVIIVEDGHGLFSDADDNTSSSTEDLNIHPDDSEYEPAKFDTCIHPDVTKNEAAEDDSDIHAVDKPPEQDPCIDSDDERLEQNSKIHPMDVEDVPSEACLHIHQDDGPNEPAEQDSYIHLYDSEEESAEEDSCIHTDDNKDGKDKSMESDLSIHSDDDINEPAEHDSFVHSIAEPSAASSVGKDEESAPPSPHKQEPEEEEEHNKYLLPNSGSHMQDKLVADSDILDQNTKISANDPHSAKDVLSEEERIETFNDEAESEIVIYRKKASFKKNKMSLKKRRSAPAAISRSENQGLKTDVDNHCTGETGFSTDVLDNNCTDETGLSTDVVESERKSSSLGTIQESCITESASLVDINNGHDNLQASCAGSIKTIQDSCMTDSEQLHNSNSDVDNVQTCSSVRTVLDSMKPATQQSLLSSDVPATATLADKTVSTHNFQCIEQDNAQILTNSLMDVDNCSPRNNTTQIAGNVISEPHGLASNTQLNIEGSVEDIFDVNNREQLPDEEEDDCEEGFSEDAGLEIIMLEDEGQLTEPDNYRVLDTEDVNNNSVVNSPESVVGNVNCVIDDSCVDTCIEDDIIDDNDDKSEYNDSQHAYAIEKTMGADGDDFDDEIDKDIEASKTPLAKSAEVNTTCIPESLENFSSEPPKSSLHTTREDECTASLKAKTLNFLSKNLGEEFNAKPSNSTQSQDSFSSVELSRPPKSVSRTARGIMARMKMKLESTDTMASSQRLLNQKGVIFHNDQDVSVAVLEDLHESHIVADSAIPLEHRTFEPEIKVSTESPSISSSGRSSKSQSLLQNGHLQNQLIQGAVECPTINLTCISDDATNPDGDNLCEGEVVIINTVSSLENIPESLTSLPMKPSQPSVRSSPIQPLMSLDSSTIQRRRTQLSDQHEHAISASYPVWQHDTTMYKRSTQRLQHGTHSKVSNDINEHTSMPFSQTAETGSKISSQDGLQSKPYNSLTPIPSACQIKQYSVENKPVNDNLTVEPSSIDCDDILDTSFTSVNKEGISTPNVSQTNTHVMPIDTEMSECDMSAYDAMADSCEFDQADGKPIYAPDQQVRKPVTLQVCDLDEEIIHDLDRQAQEAMQGLDHTTQFGTSFSSCNQSYFQDAQSVEALSEHMENDSQDSKHEQTISDVYYGQNTDASPHHSQEVSHTVTSDSLQVIADPVPPESLEPIAQFIQHEKLLPMPVSNHIEIPSPVTSQHQQSRTRSSSQWSNISFPENSQAQFPACDLDGIDTTVDFHENSQTLNSPVSSQASDTILQPQRDFSQCEISDPRREPSDMTLLDIDRTEKQSLISNSNNDIMMSTSQEHCPSEAVKIEPERHQCVESSTAASISCSVSKQMEDDLFLTDKRDDSDDEEEIGMTKDRIMMKQQHEPAVISDNATTTIAADDDVGDDKVDDIDDVVPLDLYSDSDEEWERDVHVTLKLASAYDCVKKETETKLSDKDCEIEMMKAKIALLEKQLLIKNCEKSLLEDDDKPAPVDDVKTQVSDKKNVRGWLRKKAPIPLDQTDHTRNSENEQRSGSKNVTDKHLKNNIRLEKTNHSKRVNPPLAKKCAEKSNVPVQPATPSNITNASHEREAVILTMPCDRDDGRVERMTDLHIVVDEHDNHQDNYDDDDDDAGLHMVESRSQEKQEGKPCTTGSSKFDSPSRIEDSQPEKDDDLAGSITEHDDIVVSSSDESDDLFLSPMSPSPPPPVLRSFKKLSKRSSAHLPEEFKQAEAILEELKLTGQSSSSASKNKTELGKPRMKLSDQIYSFKKNDTCIVTNTATIGLKSKDTSPVEALHSQRSGPEGIIKKVDIAESLNDDEDDHLILFSPDDDDTLAADMSLIAHGLKTEQLPVSEKMDEETCEKNNAIKSHTSLYGADKFLSPRPPEKSSRTFQSPTVSSSQSQVSVSRSTKLPLIPSSIISPAIGRLQMFGEQQAVSPNMTPSSAVLTPRPFSDNMQQGFRSPSRLSRKRCFVSSGLDLEQAQQLRQFANMSEAKFFGKFSPSVTHVIVKPVKGQLCDRTLKYFQGISNGCWIVSSKWITDCLMAKTVLAEDDYEVSGDTVNGPRQYGPRRSRTAERPMLKGFECFCSGKCDNLSKDDLRDMLEYCGATVVLDPSFFSFDPHRKCMIIDQSEEPTAKEKAVLRKYQKRFGVLTVSQEWLLDSIAQYRAQPYDEYLLLDEATN